VNGGRDIVGDVKTVRLIEEAFSHRAMPQLAAHERDDVMSFRGKPWASVTGAQLERYFEAIFWLTPEAFCYYLPGIFAAGIRENKPWLIVNHSLINMLDRSPDPDSWDDFFLARWTRLTVRECEAAQSWVLWLSSWESSSYPEIALTRAFDTLELLKGRSTT
jgi:hypothetical protein